MQWARGRVTRKGPRGGRGPALAGFVDRLRTWYSILNGMANPGRVRSRGRAWVNFGLVWLLRVWTKDCKGPRDDRGLNHRKSAEAAAVVRSVWILSVSKEGLVC